LLLNSSEKRAHGVSYISLFGRDEILSITQDPVRGPYRHVGSLIPLLHSDSTCCFIVYQPHPLVRMWIGDIYVGRCSAPIVARVVDIVVGTPVCTSLRKRQVVKGIGHGPIIWRKRHGPRRYHSKGSYS
jgi:hypothetical protein